MRSFFKNTEKGLLKKAGFTLIELMVVIAIFGLLTTVIFARQSQFSGSTLLTNVAYQIALTLRQAQVYGLSVREFTSDNFNYPYGVHFEKDMNTSVVFFVDTEAELPVSSVYDPQMPAAVALGTCGVGGNPCLDLLTITRGNYVYDVCAVPSGGSACTSADQLDVSFVRPDPEARIVSVTGGVPTGGNIRGCVTLGSTQGAFRYVIVTNTGQISVSASSCI